MTTNHSHHGARIRVLVVTNETAAGGELHDALRDRAGEPGAEILVVAPALNSRLRHWMSDTDPARRNAEVRLERCLAQLSDAGLQASGRVGDADPLQAIEDALAVFAADEIVISTHPEGRSNWLARDLVGRARARFGVPVVHIVVDLAAQTVGV